jgi:hypothetical protein
MTCGHAIENRCPGAAGAGFRAPRRAFFPGASALFIAVRVYDDVKAPVNGS